MSNGHKEKMRIMSAGDKKGKMSMSQDSSPIQETETTGDSHLIVMAKQMSSIAYEIVATGT
eukprot:CAMPEP_0196652432 /NCGR_PEP_ID=MMETSP1086-20130531/1723_1 /TAXON_ID=77921 /ORGANISM="Cyanoptyche  gloeocystis , Strain SAG4.97" /LENGTH=60 /DNA_ID=CAMNT_0041982977 /DNA_START=97 /DNA_END=279 /DNA_ORIENTATION=-